MVSMLFIVNMAFMENRNKR